VKHVVLTNTALHGFEYGTLSDFEDEILRVTSGERVAAPTRELPRFLRARLAHGTRYGGLRKYVPKAAFEVRADVLWVILMGPENFTLDMFDRWQKHAGKKVLYIFDTLESQLPAIRRVVACAEWDLLVTSFSGARDLLEKNTGRKWHVVAQGVKLDRFRPAPPQSKLITFASYGRRLDKVHRALRRHAARSGRSYDYSIAGSLSRQADSREAYDIYAWHLNHAVFNVSWPVELTHPDRVLTFSPVTCRWFEAAAAGTVVIGSAPRDPAMSEFFGEDFVTPLDPTLAPQELDAAFEELWANRERLLERAAARRESRSHLWTWEARVREMLGLLGLESDAPAAAARTA
jgi:hypothetical protein